MPQHRLKEEHAVLKSLHAALRPFAPTVYLNIPDDKNIQVDECTIARFLSEITDARLLVLHVSAAPIECPWLTCRFAYAQHRRRNTGYDRIT